MKTDGVCDCDTSVTSYCVVEMTTIKAVLAVVVIVSVSLIAVPSVTVIIRIRIAVLIVIVVVQSITEGLRLGLLYGSNIS